MTTQVTRVRQGGTGVSATPSNGQLLIGTGTGFALGALTAGSGITITNGSGSVTIASSGGSGTVTSVGLSLPGEFSVSGSPVTGSGTLTGAWANQTTNKIFAAPNGSTGAPTFRVLVAADLPGSVDYTINGQTVGKGGGAIATNTAHGVSALGANTTGTQNTAVGYQVLKSTTTQGNNTGIGYNALSAATNTGADNTAVGTLALKANTSGNQNCSFGSSALQANTSGGTNCAFGYWALYGNTTASDNCAFGWAAGLSLTTGGGNVAIGRDSLRGCSIGAQNVAVGVNAAYNVTGSYNVAIGGAASQSGGAMNYSVAVGWAALLSCTASNNTAVGYNSLRYQMDGSTANSSYSNCSGLGNDTRVSASNQVALGNSSTTTYAYGAVQDRSDARDKTDVRDTVLGLDFVKALRPVDFRWDYRDDYVDEVEETDAEGNTVIRRVPVTKDGSRKRSRFHHGVIAQELKAVADAHGVDFGGYQDHSVKGGADVLSIGYAEFVGPLIRAVQELAAEVESLKLQLSRP